MMAPRPGPRRPLLNLRLDEESIAQIKTRAQSETDGNTSELARRMLIYGLTQMPPGWKP